MGCPIYNHIGAWEPNGLPRGVTLSDFTGFCLSPVRETDGESVSVCRPTEADFWSVYGFNRDAEEWQIVHDAERDDAGEALARIVDATGEQVEQCEPVPPHGPTLAGSTDSDGHRPAVIEVAAHGSLRWAGTLTCLRRARHMGTLGNTSPVMPAKTAGGNSCARM